MSSRSRWTRRKSCRRSIFPPLTKKNPSGGKSGTESANPGRLIKPEEDIPPSELAKRYSKGLSKMKFRIQVLFALCVVLLYLTIAADGTLPLPQFFQVETRVTAAILLWGLGVACLLGLDVLWLGITAAQAGTAGGPHLDRLQRGRHVIGQHLVLPGGTGRPAAFLSAGVLLHPGLSVGVVRPEEWGLGEGLRDRQPVCLPPIV